MSKLFPAAPTSRLPTPRTTTTPSSPVSGYAIFTEIAIPPTPPPSLQNTQPSNKGSPEISARLTNEIYVSGERDRRVKIFFSYPAFELLPVLASHAARVIFGDGVVVVALVFMTENIAA
ncbi:hypothetical protein HOY80DRAFT_640223 [Tuber brumale]|nr:hypothetical protein HOY80DRAFT_676170 [Tuber brumale]KAG0642402.1 hypothetical protein HOY80DRAFT_640223 [Tuber brumale]